MTPVDFVARHPLDDVMEDEPSRGRPSVRGVVTPRLMDTRVQHDLGVVDEGATSNPDKCGTFSELLRRLNPLT
jgi:hypothetical protein